MKPWVVKSGVYAVLGLSTLALSLFMTAISAYMVAVIVKAVGVCGD